MGYISKEICLDFLDNIKSIVVNSPYPNAEIHLTEWNSSPSPRDLIHDIPFMASFILYNITYNFGKVNSPGFWTFTDIFEENGSGLIPFHGGFGLINVNNIKKPSYWAYYFLNMLGDEIVRIDDNYIITRQGDEYRIIIWNYCYYTDEFADGDRSKLTDTARDDVFKLKDIDIQIDLGAEGTGIVYTLGESTSAYHNWLKLGAPQYPTATEIIKLKEQSVPKKEQITLSAVSETLKSHEVKMYIVHKTLTG